MIYQLIGEHVEGGECVEKYSRRVQDLINLLKRLKESEKIMYDVPADEDDKRCKRKNIAVNSAVNTEAYELSLKVNKCSSTEEV